MTARPPGVPLYARSPDELVALDFVLERYPFPEDSMFWWDVRTRTRVVAIDSIDEYLELMLCWMGTELVYKVGYPMPPFDRPESWPAAVEHLFSRTLRDGVPLDYAARSSAW